MTAYKEILRIVPVAQSAALASDSLTLVKKRKKKSKDFLRSGVRAVVGTSMIKTTASVIDS